MAPAAIFSAGVGSGSVATFVAVVYVGCAAMRLGYFNIHGMRKDGGKAFYQGLPVTYAALFCPPAFLGASRLGPTAHATVMGTVMLALACSS